MADNEVNIVITATENASKVINLVGQAFNMLTGFVTKTVDSYIAYGDQVKTLSLFIGTSSEQTSRLIQVADDAFVSYDTLRLAAKTLSEKGIQPNVEDLAKLSDQFVKLKPGLEQSQFLVDNFGRSGMEMAKIMELGGSKILDMNKNIEAGLIIDDKKAAAILKTKQEMDDFNDSMDAMKYDTAQKLLDIFNGLPKPMKDVIQLMGVVGQSGMLQQFSQLAIIVVELSKAGGVGGVLTGMSTGIKALSTSLLGLQASIAPLLAVAAAIGVLVKVISDNWELIKAGVVVLGNLMGFKTPDWAYQIDLSKDTGAFSLNNLENLAGNPNPYGGKKASGGPVRPGMSYLVGENGPEIYSPALPGGIMANGSMGGTTVVIPVTWSPSVSLSARTDVENELGPLLYNYLRRQGLLNG
jgi:hypothetical protein